MTANPTPGPGMVTAGIDLSADPKKTGVATLAWTDDGATVTAVEVGQHTDADLAELIQRVDKAGIDFPLGWPIAFVDYLIAHRAGGQDLIVPPNRHPLTNRATDLHLRQAVRLQPALRGPPQGRFHLRHRQGRPLHLAR